MLYSEFKYFTQLFAGLAYISIPEKHVKNVKVKDYYYMSCTECKHVSETNFQLVYVNPYGFLLDGISCVMKVNYQSLSFRAEQLTPKRCALYARNRKNGEEVMITSVVDWNHGYQKGKLK